jgi:hypothetical protein
MIARCEAEIDVIIENCRGWRMFEDSQMPKTREPIG